MPALPDEVTLKPSPAKAVGLLFVSTGLAGAGLWLVSQGHGFGWFGAGFFGLGVVVSVLRLIPGCSFLRLTVDGFTFVSRFRGQSIKWRDVAQITVGTIEGCKMVMLDLSPEVSDHLWSQRVARTIAGHDGGLPNTHGMSPEALAELMNDYRLAAIRHESDDISNDEG